MGSGIHFLRQVKKRNEVRNNNDTQCRNCFAFYLQISLTHKSLPPISTPTWSSLDGKREIHIHFTHVRWWMNKRKIEWRHFFSDGPRYIAASFSRISYLCDKDVSYKKSNILSKNVQKCTKMISLRNITFIKF